jgi:cob(I)alamin adenosyltransferase
MSGENPPVSTGKGDDGTTTLMGAGRLSKGAPEISALGDLDETSSFLGLARAEAEGEMAEVLLDMQRLIYRIMGDVAMPREGDVVGKVEGELERWRQATELPDQFVVPGESRQGALLDVCRSVVRRAERRLVADGLHREHPQSTKAINRLSDLLFVLARAADGGYRFSRG